MMQRKILWKGIHSGAHYNATPHLVADGWMAAIYNSGATLDVVIYSPDEKVYREQATSLTQAKRRAVKMLTALNALAV